MSRRRRPAASTLNKANTLAVLNSPLARGATFTAEQVVAMMASTRASTGGAAARPLPRLDQGVPFGPGVPLTPAPINPVNPLTGRPEPRAYEYPVAANLPGFGDRLIPWKVLRDAADLISLFRRCIEIRKAEVATLDWDVTISAKAVERAQRQDPNSARSDIEKAMRERVDPHIGRLVDFWDLPDRRNGHDFIAWASKVLEEYFVLDAIAIYPRLRRNGDLFGFEVLDGTTIKPLLDEDGFRPLPPQPAFQQILYGFPRGEFIADLDEDGAIPGAYPSDRLVYKVHNVRTWTPYGFSAVEQALSDGELYARRLGWLKAEYTEGSMPAGWLMAGQGQAEWSPQELAQYERELNDYYAGNTVARQRWRILPFGMTPQEGRDLNERYRPDYDLHLIKLVASHFDTTIAELGFTEVGGLGSTGWHEGQADVQDRKATQPTLRRLQALCTHMMRTFLGAPPELEFRILGLESEDEDAADEVATRRVQSGRMTLNEDRDRTGLPRYAFPEADKPALFTQRGIVFLEGSSELGQPGQMVGPAQAVPVGAEQAGEETETGDEPGAPGAPPAAAEPTKRTAAAKTELAAYRRWLAKGKTARPFRFQHLTEAEATAAGVQLDKADFAEGVAGRAPKVRHWPGWEQDLAVAEHWAPLLHRALTGAPSGPLKLAADYLALQPDASAEHARSWLSTRRLPIADALAPVLRGLWTDGYYVGAVSAKVILAHHSVIAKAEADTLTLSTDWGAWTPGDTETAELILGDDGLGAGLRALLEHGGIVLKSIADTKLDQLAAILADGVEKGLAPAEIGRNIRGLVDDAKWAYRVALTETTRAVSAATLLRYARNGVSAKEWMTAADQHVCVPCTVNEDQGAIVLDAAFADGNDAPPGHPLCRCSIAPAWLTPEEAAAQGTDLGTGVMAGGPDAGSVVGPGRQALINEADAVVKAAIRVEQALFDGADLATAVEMIDVEAESSATVARMVDALQAAGTTPVKAIAQIRRLAADQGLKPISRAGSKVKFDVKLHRALGRAQIEAGTTVQVLEPGYILTLPDGERVVMERALIAEIQPTTATVTAKEAKSLIKFAEGIESVVRNDALRPGVGDWMVRHLAGDLAIPADVRDRVLQAVEAADPVTIRQVVADVLRRAGIVEDGRAGERVAFDPKLHVAAGRTKPPAGAEVKIVKPGMVIQRGAEVVRLTRADVERVDLSRPMSELSPEARRIAETIRSEEVGRTPLGGGTVGDVSLVRYEDGTTLVRKELGSRASDVRSVRDQMDAEELAPLVLRAVGADAPEVLRVGDRVLYMSHVEGELGADIVPWGASVPAEIIDSPQGVRLGLGDLLTDNGDRNVGNWFRRPADGQLVGIDHGFAFEGETTTSPFADVFLTGGAGGLSRTEALEILDRLTALKPEFTRLRRAAWWQGMMVRMRAIVESAAD